ALGRVAVAKGNWSQAQKNREHRARQGDGSLRAGSRLLRRKSTQKPRKIPPMPGSARAMARWAAVHSGHVSRLGAFALLAGLACSSKAPTDRQLISTSSTTSSTGADTATSSGASAGGAASATLTSGVPIHGAT